MHCATSSNALLATAPNVQVVLIIHAMQDVDGKLKDFQEKQNIDIGLIMGRGNNNASLVSDKMPVLPRANIMRMGATRSLSVSKSLRDLPTASLQQLGCLEAWLCAGLRAAFNDSIELLLKFACFALHAGAAPDAHQLSLLVCALVTQSVTKHTGVS